MRNFALAAAAFAVIGGAAHAADLGRIHSAPPPVESPIDTGYRPFTWTGLYVGANGGYAWGDADWTFPDSASAYAFTDEGAMAGGQIGLNWQFGRAVVAGIEGTMDWTDLSGKTSCPEGVASCRLQTNWTGDVSGRLGVAFGRALLYGKGGVAFADMEHARASLTDPALSAGSGSEVKTGYLVGGGLEYALTDHLTWKIEYNYMDFGSSESYSLTTGAAGATPILEDRTLNAVKTGLNFKF